MCKHKLKRSAFTLIEVMVAVLIVSVVIAALLEMRGNTTNKFFNIKKMIKTNQYSSFLLSQSDKYGFEKSNIDMKRLVEDFDLESDLRRRLSSMKVALYYDELEVIDTSEYSDTEDEDGGEGVGVGSAIVFEIGRTTLKTDDFSSSLTRIRLQ